MDKVEAYKDSKGNLFEKYDEYVVSEYNILRDNAKRELKFIKDIIQNDPFKYYHFLNEMTDRSLNFGEACKETFSKYKKIEANYKRITSKKYSDHSEVADPNWNQIPGSINDGISFQDII